MKLLFCIKAMNNPGGGAERVLADVANGLSRRGHEVAVLTFEAPGGRSFYPLDEGIERICLSIGSSTRPATLGETLQRLPALRRVVKAHGPDVAIGFMHSMYIPLAVALAGSGVPVIASEHTPPENYRGRRLQALLLGLVPPLVRSITTVSERARAQYPPGLRRKMVVVRNPLSIGTAGRADVSDQQTRRSVLLCVGRLVPQKDHATLIDAFATIAGDVPGWDLRIVGDGELGARLADRIAGLGMDGRIRLAPSTAAIDREYAGAQLFVVPSRFESLGLATAEALAHGLPVVGFADCPGTNELVRHEVNGVLVAGEGDRTANLAGALRALMLDEAGRRRLAEAADIVPALDPATILPTWEALLVEAESGGPTKDLA